MGIETKKMRFGVWATACVNEYNFVEKNKMKIWLFGALVIRNAATLFIGAVKNSKATTKPILCYLSPGIV